LTESRATQRPYRHFQKWTPEKNEKSEEPEYRGTTLVPMVVEQTSRGERARYLFALLKEHIIFIGDAD